jgi:hypothetical protein
MVKNYDETRSIRLFMGRLDNKRDSLGADSRGGAEFSLWALQLAHARFPVCDLPNGCHFIQKWSHAFRDRIVFFTHRRM